MRIKAQDGTWYTPCDFWRETGCLEPAVESIEVEFPHEVEGWALCERHLRAFREIERRADLQERRPNHVQG